MKLKSIHKRFAPQRGDTLIEVLLAMSIIGLVLAASFGIANRATQTGRTAQERTEALKIAESQIELLKVHLQAGGFNPGAISPFCIDESEPAATAAVNSDGMNPTCTNIDGVGGSGLYTVAIVDNSGTYEVNVQWDRVGTVRGTLTLFYRAGVL